jgi:hypothetical protein
MWQRRHFTLTALCALAAGFAAIVPAADAQTAPQPTWHISAQIPGPGGLITLYQMTAVRGDAWAAGQGGPTGYGPQIEEWNGTGWIDRTPAHLNTGQISVIGMSSPTNVWAAAGDVGNYALRWDGHKWSYFPFHTSMIPTGLAVLSPRDVWVFGYFGEYAPFVRQFDGRHWHGISSPIVPLAASAVSPHDIWTVGAVGSSFATNPNDYPSALANWNGWRWHTVPLPNLHIGRKQSFQPLGMTALGPKDVWVDGEVNSQSGIVNVRSLLLHWNGKRWGLFRSPVNELAQVASDGTGGVWLTADPGSPGRADLVHFRNFRWTVIPSPLPTGQANDTDDLYGLVNVPGTTQEWAGGWIAQPSSLPLGLVDVFSP